MARYRKYTEAEKEAARQRTTGNKNPFFGKHHTIETKTKISKNVERSRKISEALKGKPKSEEHKRKLSESRKGRFTGINSPNYGKPKSEESKRKNREWHLGKLTGDSNPAKRPEVRIKISMGRKGIPQSEKSKKLMSESRKKGILEGSIVSWNKGYTKKTHPSVMNISLHETGKIVSDETRKKMSNVMKTLFKNPEFAMRHGKALRLKPNQTERYLDAVLQLNFPHQWRYTGDFAFWIDGKNPDFINTQDKKLLIEYNGFIWKDIKVGHTSEKDIAKTEHYEKHGWKVLNLYPKDLKDEFQLIEKIRNFIES